MKKAILLLSIFFFSFNLYSKKEEYIFQKDESIFLNPIENPDAKLLKILKYISQKNFKKAKSKLYNLKLEFSNKEKINFLENFIEFLEKPENNGLELLPLLNLNIPSHLQIKAEILWIEGKKIESFKIYDSLEEIILKNEFIRKHLEKRIKNYSENLDKEIENCLYEGNFENLCLIIQSLPEKIFKNQIYYKGMTLCSIINGDLDKSKYYLNLMEEKERKDFEFFVEILNMELSEQLKELKNFEFSKKQKMISKYIYNRTEDLWLLENMPPCYLNAYNSENINLKELCLLFCLYFPQIKAKIDEPFESKNNLDKYETECLLPLFLSKTIDENSLDEKIYGDNFIYYIKKFAIFLNLLNPCEGNWESYINCGMIPREKEKEKIDGKFAASFIRRLRGQ